MRTSLNIQTGGSLAMVSAFAASELAARLLEAHPGSYLAWSLNAGLFRTFESARIEMLPSRFMFGPAALPAAFLLVIIILIARKLESRFFVALAANLSFLGSITITYAALHGTEMRQAEPLSTMGCAQTCNFLIVAGLLCSSATAFIASHWSFLGAIFTNIPSRTTKKPDVAFVLQKGGI